MKTPLGIWLLTVFTACAVLPASVSAGPGDGGGRHRHRFAETDAVPPGLGMERPVHADRSDRLLGPRDFRRDDMPMFGRMSREERQQLRRDIRSAGEDIYRRPPPPPPYEPEPRQ